jgi:hypothetical protein
VPDQDGVAQVQVLQQGGQAGREGVVVVTQCGLAGVAEPAPIVGDHPVAGFQQHRDLFVPGAAAEGVAVDQHHRWPGAVVFVVQGNRPRVLFTDRQIGHEVLLWYW